MAHVRVTADRKLQTGVHGKLCLSGGVHPTHAHACTCIPHMHRVVLVSIATRDVQATLWDVVGLDASPCSGCNGPPRIDAPRRNLAGGGAALWDLTGGEASERPCMHRLHV